MTTSPAFTAPALVGAALAVALTTAAGQQPAAPKALAVSPEEVRKALVAPPAAKTAEAGEASAAKPPRKTGVVSTMDPGELAEFADYPPELQGVVRKALELTTQKLRYQFGSCDPKCGGMDCSGTLFCVLKDAGFTDVPRQSDEICHWVMRRSVLYRTEDVVSLKNPAFARLQPGDLLFWTGTYETGGGREIPISHVMMYLGTRKADGKPVVFGASDGRTYDGERRNGVSVFDFSLPHRGGRAAFYGYGPIPDIARKESPEQVRRAIVRAVPAYAGQ